MEEPVLAMFEMTEDIIHFKCKTGAGISAVGIATGLAKAWMVRG
jgi:hypothetical protein